MKSTLTHLSFVELLIQIVKGHPTYLLSSTVVLMADTVLLKSVSKTPLWSREHQILNSVMSFNQHRCLQKNLIPYE